MSVYRSTHRYARIHHGLALLGLVLASARPQQAVGASCLAGNELCFADAVKVIDMMPEVQGIAVGYINGGNNLDLVASSTSGDNIRIRLGNGQGGFSGGYNWTMGNKPLDVALGDFDGDGKTDIISPRYDDDRVRIRWGDSNWSQYTGPTVGERPGRVTVGDLNGDGRDDFATTNWGDDTITVRLNNGGTGFASQSYAAGTSVNSIDFGDLDGDGDLDMVYASGFNEDSRLRVRKNNGDGSFGAPSSFNISGGFFSGAIHDVKLGDLNEDGSLDVIVARADHTLVRGIGTGTGSFNSFVESEVSNNPYTMEMTDLNHDGHEDLVVGHLNASRISMYLGQGNGNLSGPYTIDDPGSWVMDVATGDFNNDNRPDIAFGGLDGAYLLLSERPSRWLPGDLTEDGLVDAADAGFMFANWGERGRGDLNGDGTVDAADAGALFSQWGMALDAAPVGIASPTGVLFAGEPMAMVPEPTTLPVVAIGIVWALGRRRRRNADPTSPREV